VDGDGSSIGIELVIIIALIIANGLFAMCEMSIVSSRKSKLENMSQNGDDGAQAALELAENPSKMLSAIQIGITLIGIFTGAVGGASLARTFSEWLSFASWLAPWRESISLGLVVAMITYLSLIVGELVPKQIALSNSEGIASKLAKFMKFFSWLMSPFVYFLSISSELILKVLGIKIEESSVASEAEIRQLVRENVFSGGDVQPSEERMVQRIFRLGDARVEALMTPRTQLEWIDLDDDLDMVIKQVSRSKHSRFPVAQGELDEVKGFFYTRDILNAWKKETALFEVPIRPALFVPRSLPALELFELFRKKGAKEALVLDEYGGLSGLISLYDLLSEVIGEFPTEEEGKIDIRSDGSWLVDGILPIQDMKEALQIENIFPGEEDNEYNTVGGWVTYLLGHIPTATERVGWEEWQIEVVDMDRARVDKILIWKNPEENGGIKNG